MRRIPLCRWLVFVLSVSIWVHLWPIPASRAAEPSALELVQSIVLKGKPGKLDHLALDAKGDRLFLANKVNNTLDVVDLKGGKLLKQIPNQQGVQGLAYATDLDRLFVALGGGGFCNVFDGKDLTLLKTIKYTDDADNVRYNPQTHLVYVAHAEKALGVIDAKTFEQKPDIKLAGAAEGFQLETARPRLFLSIPSPSQVAVIDTDKNEVVANYPVKMAGAAHPLALDEPNHRIFVGCRKAPMVVVLDSETGKEITGVAIPEEVDDVWFDAKRKRLYASCGEGFIAVIRQMDPDHYEMAEKIATAKGAKTCLFDADSGRLFLAVPRQADKEGPEIRVYQVKP
jgi:DNA-binding beta-propeller fold protein YncE